MSNTEWNFDNFWPDSSEDCFKEVQKLLSPDLLKRERYFRYQREQAKLAEERAIDYAIANHRVEDPYFPRPPTLPSFNDSTRYRRPEVLPKYKTVEPVQFEEARVIQHRTNQYGQMPFPPPVPIHYQLQPIRPPAPPPTVVCCKFNHAGKCCNKLFEYKTQEDIAKHLFSDSHPPVRALPGMEYYGRSVGICEWEELGIADGKSMTCGLAVPFCRLAEHIERRHLKRA